MKVIGYLSIIFWCSLSACKGNRGTKTGENTQQRDVIVAVDKGAKDEPGGYLFTSQDWEKAKKDFPIQDLKVPAGYTLDLYAPQVPNARSMCIGAKGTVFVGNKDEDAVYALVDKDNDGKADTRYTLAKGLNSPNGVAFYKGSLYVAEISRILRFDSIETHLANPLPPVVVTAKLPTDGHHGWKYIAFGPDGKLYVPIGAPCNVCDDDLSLYSSIHQMNPDGTGMVQFAKGIRNTVGFTWHPTTKELWFTDNGRDGMDDNTPADELNVAPKPGMNFGFPYCHAGDVLDPKYGDGKKCSDYTAPSLKLNPHAAALGIKFIPNSTNWPGIYHGSALIAEHGSWNRSSKIGYVVSMALFQDGKPVDYTPFIWGWLRGEKAWGRPVDLLFLKDGSLLISDDKAGVVYRVKYTG